MLAGYLAFYLARAPGRDARSRSRRACAPIAPSARAPRSRQSLNDALLAFFQGRYASAEKSAATALAGEETKGVAAIIAARSAHELGRFSEREQFLDQAKGAAPEVDQARLTTLADLLVSQGRYEEALAVLKDLSARDARNLRLLRLQLQAEQAHAPLGRGARDRRGAREAGRHRRPRRPRRAARARTSATSTARRRTRPRSPRTGSSCPRTCASIRRSPPPPRATTSRSAATPRRRRSSSRRSSASGTRAWSRSTARRAGTDALPQIERAEKWLRAHARDPALLLALGKLCMRQELWGKAQSYIEASLALEPTHDGHMTLAALMEQIGKPQEAVQHFRRSAELAG